MVVKVLAFVHRAVLLRPYPSTCYVQRSYLMVLAWHLHMLQEQLVSTHFYLLFIFVIESILMEVVKILFLILPQLYNTVYNRKCQFVTLCFICTAFHAYTTASLSDETTHISS